MNNKYKEIKTKISDNRNIIFLAICLFAHICYLITFTLLKIYPLIIINAISSTLYVIFLISSFKNKESEILIVEAYFEILVYSFVAEIFTRSQYGYLFFALGMVIVIFFLVPSYKNKRYIFQLFGIAVTLLIHHVDLWVPQSFFEETYKKALPYGATFNFINLVTILATLLYTCFVYELQLDKMQSRLDYNSTHDLLTGLFNRRYINEYVKEQSDSNNITVALLDVDDFKHVNDTFGHAEGDIVLKNLANYLDEEANKNEGIAVRWGGEEFIIYYKTANTELVYSNLAIMCDKIRKNIILPDGKSLTVTIGLSSGKNIDFEKVVKLSDEYLYYGKHNGKNRIIKSDSVC